jgi:hypothetical protein
MYPSGKNLPLMFNRIVPEQISAAVLKIAQPNRDLSGHEGKFRAYYRMCGNPSPRLRAWFETLGYEILAHSGFVGHDYYKRIPVLRDLERMARASLVKAGIGITSAQLLIMRRR